MADVDVRGFVSKPAVKKGANGDFSVFTLAEGVKGKDGKWVNFFYNVTNFKSPTPPEDGSRVRVKGWQKLRYYERGGVKHISLDIQAQEDIEVLNGPKDGKTGEGTKPGGAGAGGPGSEAFPWDDTAPF